MTIYPPAYILFLVDKPLNLDQMLQESLGEGNYNLGRVSFWHFKWAVIAYDQDLCKMRQYFAKSRVLRLTRTGIIMDAAGNNFGEFSTWQVGQRPFPDFWFQNDDLLFKIEAPKQ